MLPVVPDAWQPQLRLHLGEDRDRLDASDFPTDQSVAIRFPDGSHVFFRHAFAITERRIGEVAIFSEHCGYHIFPSGDAEIEVLRSV